MTERYADRAVCADTGTSEHSPACLARWSFPDAPTPATTTRNPFHYIKRVGHTGGYTGRHYIECICHTRVEHQNHDRVWELFEQHKHDATAGRAL